MIDYITFAADTGLNLDGAVDGTLTAFTIEADTGILVELSVVIAPANGSTVLLPVLASSLGSTADTGPIELTAAGLTILDGTVPADEIDASAVFDPFAPGAQSGSAGRVAPRCPGQHPGDRRRGRAGQPDGARLAGGHP